MGQFPVIRLHVHYADPTLQMAYGSRLKPLEISVRCPLPLVKDISHLIDLDWAQNFIRVAGHRITHKAPAIHPQVRVHRRKLEFTLAILQE